MTSKNWFVLAIFPLILAACDLKQSTDHMRDTTDHLSDNSDILAKRTSDLESELTFKESFYMLVMNKDYLTGENGKDAGNSTNSDDNRLNPDADMVVFATGMIKSLLFQYWKGDFSDTVETLDNRFVTSAEAFYGLANGQIPRDFKIDKWFPNRSYKAMASLGAVMDEVRPEYNEALAKKGLKDLSLYDLTIMALQNRQASERKEILPKTVAKILFFEQEATYLLQLRHNYLPMIVLSRMSNLQETSTLQKMWKAVVPQTIDISKANPEQLRQWTTWLNKALKTRQALREMGIEPVYNSGMQKILQNVTFDFNSTEKTSLLLKSQVQEFKEAYQRVISAQ